MAKFKHSRKARATIARAQRELWDLLRMDDLTAEDAEVFHPYIWRNTISLFIRYLYDEYYKLDSNEAEGIGPPLNPPPE